LGSNASGYTVGALSDSLGLPFPITMLLAGGAAGSFSRVGVKHAFSDTDSILRVLRGGDELAAGRGGLDDGLDGIDIRQMDLLDGVGNPIESGGTINAVEGAGSKLFNSLDDYIADPKKLGNATPEQMYKYLQDNGYNPQPLSGGRQAGKLFTDGGGFKVNWGGDRILQYHPAGLNHHGGGAYFKISSGPTGTQWFNLDGTPLITK
jgi:hypothetical protein